MTKSDKGLGRGLGSMFTAPAAVKQETVREIPLTDILNRPDQPRKTFDEESLNELAASIKDHGILQPILVRPRNGRYEIIAGERRWRAAKIAGLATIPAILRDADVVYIASAAEKAGAAARDDGRININTAPASELTDLPGIGEKRASDITDYRELNGAFKSTEDIMLVSGIGEALYEKIKDKICVSGY